MRNLSVFVALAVVGCNPDMSGTYQGSLDEVFTCDDGDSGSHSGLATWKITTNTNTLTINTSGFMTCGLIVGVPKGLGLAEMRAKECFSGGGAIVTLKSGGTLQLEGNKLRVKFENAATFVSSNGGVVGCQETVSGVLEEF